MLEILNRVHLIKHKDKWQSTICFKFKTTSVFVLRPLSTNNWHLPDNQLEADSGHVHVLLIFEV